MWPRRKKRKTSASNWAGLGIPKVRPREAGELGSGETEAEAKERRDWIARIRGLVFSRDRKCRACRDGKAEHMHEIQSRAKLRGKHFREIFTLSNCLMLCESCHRRVHAINVGGFFWRIHGTDANTTGAVRFERVEVKYGSEVLVSK